MSPGELMIIFSPRNTNVLRSFLRTCIQNNGSIWYDPVLSTLCVLILRVTLHDTARMERNSEPCHKSWQSTWNPSLEYAGDSSFRVGSTYKECVSLILLSTLEIESIAVENSSNVSHCEPWYHRLKIFVMSSCVLMRDIYCTPPRKDKLRFMKKHPPSARAEITDPPWANIECQANYGRASRAWPV